MLSRIVTIHDAPFTAPVLSLITVYGSRLTAFTPSSLTESLQTDLSAGHERRAGEA
jgi:hypothetical protein